MRSREDFKALVYEKCEAQRYAKRKKRRQLAAMITPIAACLIICFAVFALPIFDFQGSKEASGTSIGTREVSMRAEHSVTVLSYKEAVSVRVTASGGDSELEQIYTDSERIDKIVSYFNNLKLSDSVDNIPESYGTSYFVTITYSDGSELLYTHLNNKYLWINGGAPKEMKPDEAAELENILRELQLS